MEAFPVVSLIVGLLFLLGGAESLVRGASALAQRLGIPPLVVGLTVVAFGTSSPELAVSMKGAFGGQANVALGNVVGSNIFNTFLILGVSALIAPLVVAQQLVRREVPLMILASVALLVMGLNGAIGTADGTILLVGFVAYTLFILRESRQTKPEVVQEYDASFGVDEARPPGVAFSSVLVAGGLALLILGSDWFVDGAISIARSFNVSELVISLTVVAAGTSLPELVTSILAALRGERDIAVGNVVGSNLFNVMAILGLTAVISPAAIPIGAGVLTLDLPIMIASAVACLPVFLSGHKIDRWEGAIFVGFYVAYVVYLLLVATSHEAQNTFATAMMYFVVPICALTIAVILARGIGNKGAGA